MLLNIISNDEYRQLNMLVEDTMTVERLRNTVFNLRGKSEDKIDKRRLLRFVRHGVMLDNARVLASYDLPNGCCLHVLWEKLNNQPVHCATSAPVAAAAAVSPEERMARAEAARDAAMAARAQTVRKAAEEARTTAERAVAEHKPALVPFTWPAASTTASTATTTTTTTVPSKTAGMAALPPIHPHALVPSAEDGRSQDPTPRSQGPPSTRHVTPRDLYVMQIAALNVMDSTAEAAAALPSQNEETREAAEATAPDLTSTDEDDEETGAYNDEACSEEASTAQEPATDGEEEDEEVKPEEGDEEEEEEEEEDEEVKPEEGDEEEEEEEEEEGSVKSVGEEDSHNSAVDATAETVSVDRSRKEFDVHEDCASETSWVQLRDSEVKSAYGKK